MKREATLELCVGECGSACCRTPAMELRLTEGEARRLELLAAKKRIRLGPRRTLDVDAAARFALGMGPMGRCSFLQDATGLCRIYPNRPACCRTFPHRPVAGCLVWPADGADRELAAGEPREVKP